MPGKVRQRAPVAIRSPSTTKVLATPRLDIQKPKSPRVQIKARGSHSQPEIKVKVVEFVGLRQRQAILTPITGEKLL